MEEDRQAARSSSRDTVDPSTQRKFRNIFNFLLRQKNNTAAKLWISPALRPWLLTLTILICWSFIAILQYFLTISQREGGIIFAPKINALPLSRSFLYLYFPTVLAVLFSIYWTWIDLETKRLEPYYQLSKKDGALGKDSLLLHYPFDFIPLVPVKAFRDRHWPVFWASFAVVLVTWGIVPTQAGIFSTKSLTRTYANTFIRSRDFIPADQQESALTLRFAQSTYGIVSLNETLPPFMTRNYTLAPVKLSSETGDFKQATGNWTVPTTMYSLDLRCEKAWQIRQSRGIRSNSSTGCSFQDGLDGNLTIDGSPNLFESDVHKHKAFSAMYVGYWNLGFADYSLDYGSCPLERNHTFYAAFSRNKIKKEDPPQNVTAIFCEPMYYQQDVNATIDVVTRSPLDIAPLSPKEQLATKIFNTTWLEALINGGSLGIEVKGDVLPSKAIPKYVETLAATNLSLPVSIQPMVGLAIAVDNRPLEEYLDWEALSKSYAKAYRLIFARAMFDVLGGNFTSSENVDGYQRITTEAVVLEPVFTYIVEGLLGVVSIAAMALLYLSVARMRTLRFDPNTIASIMSLVADDQALLSDFEDLDCYTMEDIQEALRNKRYKLMADVFGNRITEVEQVADIGVQDQLRSSAKQRQGTPKEITKPIRPKEFNLWMAIPLVGLFIALAVTLTIIFIKAKPNGLPLPSSNTIVQNLLENYIPTAIATLIEPMWILINRLLCMLQPLEELQDCNAGPKTSIDLNYNSLPPQLVVFKALRSKHFILSAVCAMALLANILAIAFAGLFNQGPSDVWRPATFPPPFELKFVSINGSIGPDVDRGSGSSTVSGAYQGGTGEDQFLIAESNNTRGTPLPAWTDKTMFYLPFISSFNLGNTNDVEYRARTLSFGAELDCEPLEFGIDYRAALVIDDGSMQVVFNTTVREDSTTVQCPNSGEADLRWGPISPFGPPTSTCQRGPSSAEVSLLFRASQNTTRQVKDACMATIVLGWLRAPDGSCGDFPVRDLDQTNSLFVRCKPRWVKGRATVQVDSRGRLQKEVEDAEKDTNFTDDELAQAFSNDPVNLIGQSNQYLFPSIGSAWHNDSFADSFINHFAIRASNSTRLVDPSAGPPNLKEIQDSVGKAYSSLFAIWLGANKEKLLVPYDKANKAPVAGWTIQTEERLFVSIPMFAIAEGILCSYAIVAIMVYMRRPGQYLARLPTSIASVLALFAASSAVQDMRNTSHLGKKERAQHLEKLGLRYGYGSYIGGDGRVHIGIEKSPFVRPRPSATWLERKMKLFRNGSVV